MAKFTMNMLAWKMRSMIFAGSIMQSNTYGGTQFWRSQVDINHQGISDKVHHCQYQEKNPKEIRDQWVLGRKLRPVIVDHLPQFFRKIVHLSGP